MTEFRTFGAKRPFVTAILRQLGYEVPDDATLQRAIVEAARQAKSEAGLDPGPNVKIALVPLPGAAVKE